MVDEVGSWRRTSPLAIISFLGETLKTLARNWDRLAAIMVGPLAFLLRFGDSKLLLVAAGALALGSIGVAALLRYWFFRFQFREDRILIRKGVIKRTALDVPYERIQGINVERSLLQRLFGMVSVSLDTAGSEGAEARLPAVRPELADRLRTRIDVRRDPADSVIGEPGSAEGVLLQLGGGDMVRIGLANGKAWAVALGFAGALVSALPDTLFEAAAEALEGTVNAATEELDQWGGLVASAAVAGLVLTTLVVVLAATTVAAFLRHHRFTLRRDGSIFRSRAGLLTQREVVVERTKIQQLSLRQNFVMRGLGRYRLKALTVSGGTGLHPQLATDQEEFIIPLLGPTIAEEVRSRAFETEADRVTLLPKSAGFIPVSGHYLRVLVLRIGLLPALVAMVVGMVVLAQVGTAGAVLGGIETAAFFKLVLACLAWIALATVIAWQLWRRRGYMHDDDGMASRSGFVGYRVDAFLFRKAQSVEVTTSPLQRRKGLATLLVSLASDEIVSVPYVDHATASRLRDHILYRVESSRAPWH